MSDQLAIIVLVVAMPLNWMVTIMLWRLHLQFPSYRLLRERGIVATGVSIIVTVFALVFLNNDTIPPPFDLAWTKVITRATILVFSVVPALYWLYLYRRPPL